MTRRERKQLLRTASDIFRMVPLAVSFVQVYQRLVGTTWNFGFSAWKGDGWALTKNVRAAVVTGVPIQTP